MQNSLNRTLTHAIERDSTAFKVLLLIGPRQVGKTFLLKHAGQNNRSYVTLDDITMRAAAQQDPASFIERLKLPVLIDEVQYAPNLFPYIKMKVDNSDENGQFWLTGSQQFEMMRNVTESLAGRVAILKLQGISLAEEQGRTNDKAFLPELELLKARQNSAKSLNVPEVYHKIWRGSYPQMVLKNGKDWERFYDSYILTYILHDVQDYLKIDNTTTFLKFMQVAAARTGQIINYSDMAKDVGISEVTAKSWLNVLQACGIIYQLQPYFSNLTNRIIKTPKLYFMDTGLCSFLGGWLSSEILERGAMSGAMLETYVISEIIKSYLHNGRSPRIYFYRDKEKREIDLIIEENGQLYPIEIKKTATITSQDYSNFSVLKNLNIPISHGSVICMVNSLVALSKDVDAVPVGWI